MTDKRPWAGGPTMDPLDDALGKVNFALNVVSAVCGLLAVVIIGGCMSCRSMDRVSIRFTLAISVVDVVKSLAIVFYNNYSQDDALCTGLSFVINCLTLVYIFLNTAVALNLQLVFCHGMMLDIEGLLWAGSIGIPVMLLAVPLAAGKLGLQEENGFCEFRNPSSGEGILYSWVFFISWGLLACCYCTVAVVMIVVQLRKKINVLDRVILIRTSSRDAIVRDNLALRNRIGKLIGRM
ncbi:hypothetical protein DSO57_1013628 [Entomophthora muscae]|uniref:Uncharacterized protein n=1 Tax=Entomophthora muscae TaxID=34485 RepID=A0ACC2SII4_9FUNG|nr:hypothetical protein DSO57_1013628 [Entomophthora muscae]